MLTFLRYREDLEEWVWCQVEAYDHGVCTIAKIDK